MSTYFDLHPVPFKGMTRVIGGRDLTEAERASGLFVGDDIGGLPVVETGGGFISRWHCKKLWWRIVFLFTGNINLSVAGDKHPPCAVFVGKTM